LGLILFLDFHPFLYTILVVIVCWRIGSVDLVDDPLENGNDNKDCIMLRISSVGLLESKALALFVVGDLSSIRLSSARQRRYALCVAGL
jgi:hypothetical protein